MGSAAAFIWVMVVILALAWALAQTGTLRLGVNFDMWVNILLVLAVLGAIFNLFIAPFLGRRTTTTTSSSAQGSTTAGPGVAPTAPTQTTGASGAEHHEVVQETRDRPSL
jgi:hypothetical protein